MARAGLDTYNAKRRFGDTPEPEGKAAPRKRGKKTAAALSFVVQKHDATRLHYDFRLELDGVLLSWAVTKGPSLNPADKRLAVRTEDHPLTYGGFEGIIPKGNYGAGTVMLWDQGTWEPIGDPHAELAKGKIAFNLFGRKMRGRWALVLMRHASDAKRENWLLIKERDEEASTDRDLTAEETESVASGRDLDAIAAEGGIWRSRPAGKTSGKSAKPRAPSHKRPSFVEPQLATLVDEPPEGDGWIFEVKYDGYRTQLAASGAEVRAYTRTGLDWTEKFPGIVAAVKSLDLDGVLLDGEIVALDGDGRSDFGLMQTKLQEGGQDLVYCVFDLLREGGTDWRGKPLEERKARLATLLQPAAKEGVIVFSDHIAGNGTAMMAMAEERHLEGVIAKRADAPYRSGRGQSWLKIKVAHRQEFIVIGYRGSQRNRAFSSLILAVREGRSLRYAGRVGSGFSQVSLGELADLFAKRTAARPPAGVEIPAEIRRDAHWVKPDLVVEIAFNGWTRDQQIRQGHYLGLRADKPASDVVQERAVTKKPETPAAEDAPRLTHPDKLLYPDPPVTKQDLADYLAQVAERMMPHLAGRLVSLVRCPEGVEHERFFQRHPMKGMDASWLHKAIKTTHREEEYLYCEEPRALVAAAQWSVLEFHLWGSHLDHLETPDRIVFDLDPDEGFSFADVKGVALHLREVLAALKLASWPLLSGGKGLHVVVPITPGPGWPEVKAFAADLVARLVAEDPKRLIGTMSKAKRKEKLFIDHFRNERGSTAICPYSPRARPGASVAWPVTWEALPAIRTANAVTMAEALKRLADDDPWADYFATKQSLTKAAMAAVRSD